MRCKTQHRISTLQFNHKEMCSRQSHKFKIFKVMRQKREWIIKNIDKTLSIVLTKKARNEAFKTNSWMVKT